MKTSTRPRNAFSRTLAIVIGAFLMLGIAPASAVAATMPGVTQSASVQAPTKIDDGSDPELKSNSTFITINRWAAPSADLHNRANLLDPGQVASTAVRMNTQETGLTAVSGLWHGTAIISDFASNLEPIDGLGIIVDRGAASLGKVIIGNPLIFVIAGLVSIFAAIWNKARGRDGGGLVKTTLSVVIVFVTVAAMTLGASASSPKIGDEGNYVPGVASPGWFITKINTTISGAADAALTGVAGIDFGVDNTGITAADGKLGCATYTQALKDDREQRSGAGTASMEAISGMWETSGLRSWVNVQFGENKYADKVWCHRLEMNAGVSSISQRLLTTDLVEGGEELFKLSNPKSTAFFAPNENIADRSIIAWAACDWNGSGWTVDPGFAYKAEGQPEIKPSSCTTWWEGGQDADLDAAGFNLGTGEPGPKQIHEVTEDEDVIDFVQSWQGRDDGIGGTALIAWSVFAAVVMFLILGLGLSIIVAVAKILSVIAMATIIIVLVGSLFTRDGPGPKLAALVKRVLGYSLLAAGSSAIVLLITWMTQSLISLGNIALDPGSTPAMIWTALSPILALIALHALFKSFKLPSPVTAKGALAWGAAGGAAGSVIGGGIASRLADRGQGAATGAAKRGGSALLNRASGGKLGTPIRAGGKTREAAGLPAVAAAGAGASASALAAKEEMDAARAHAKQSGAAVPMTASERANAAVRAGSQKTTVSAGDALLGTFRAAKKAPQVAAAVGREARQLPANGAFLLDAMKSAEGRSALRDVAGERTREAVGAGKERAKRAAVWTATAAKTPIVHAYKASVDKTSTAIADKARKFAENPVTESWKVTKGAAKVGVVGVAALATGGLAIPAIAAVAGVRRVDAARMGKRNVKSEATQRMLSDYREHVEDQKQLAIAAKQAADAPQAETKSSDGSLE